MTPELEVVCDVGARLDSAGLSYMLTGSLCLSFYTLPRMTRDVDVVIALPTTQTQKLLNVLSPAYYVDAELVRSEAERTGRFNVFHEATAIKIDFIVRKSEPYRLTEFQRRRRVELEGVPLWIVSREDLILSKLIWARDSDSDHQLRDVRALLSTTLEHDYLETWIKELKLLELWQKVHTP